MPTDESNQSAGQLPARRPARRLPAGLGYFLLFVLATALLAANASLLQAMIRSVAAQRRSAEEAKRPAEVDVVALISPACASCYNVTGLVTNIGANQKVKVTTSRTVDVGSSEGVGLINTYALTRAPAFIIRGQTEKLLAVLPGLQSFGRLAGSNFVGATVPAPYVDLVSGNIRGTFTATYVTEKSCAACYDPTINRQALGQLGMKPATEQTVDRLDPEGRRLVKQYKLTTVPTLLLTGDLAAYDGFDQIWKNVGTIESDGTYVFRTGQSRMGTYYDLTAKKVIAPATASTNTNTTP